MRRSCAHILLAAAVGVASAAAVPAAATEEDFQIWVPAALTLSVGERFQGYFEVQPRIGDDATEVTQLILRSALGYRVAPAWSLWLGYAWVPTFVPSTTEENRVYQQLLGSGSLATARWLSRTRLEERWIEGVGGTSLRLRSFLRGQVPIDGERRWAFVAWDEIFFNLNTPGDTGPRAGFDQNRFFVGVNRTVSEFLSVDFGYQLQFVDTREPGFADRVNHILLLQFLMQH